MLHNDRENFEQIILKVSDATGIEAIKRGTAHVFINKEAKRVDKDAIVELNGKGVLVTFPENSKKDETKEVLGNQQY